GHLLERVEIEGFAPRKPVPISILNYVPKNKRKPQDQRPRRDNGDKRNAK
ncbi:ATP-dependent helicase, partial [Vibrio owensii]